MHFGKFHPCAEKSPIFVDFGLAADIITIINLFYWNHYDFCFCMDLIFTAGFNSSRIFVKMKSTWLKKVFETLKHVIWKKHVSNLCMLSKSNDIYWAYITVNKTWLWNTDAPGGNKVQIWQKSQSPSFWPRPTPRGMWCQWSVRNP